MPLTQDEVIHILKLIDEAPVGRFSLQLGDLKLEVAKGVNALSATTPPVAMPPAATPSPATVFEPAKAPAGEPRIEAAPPAAEPRREPPLAAAGKLDAIKAPILGIFYRRPNPGSPPYVEEGSLVEEDTTVALIEVMKLFNPVKAGMRGRIHSVCVENGALVEYGQPLFLITPL